MSLIGLRLTELNMNRDAIRFIADYFKELEAGNAAVFAGAGFSAPAGYVDWRGLLKDIAEDLELDIDRETDLVSLAQFHVNKNGRNRHKLNQAIIEAVADDGDPGPNHRLLARLPISTWWTTNYDQLIERSLRDAGKVVDVKITVPQLADTRPRRDAIVYKMHGDVGSPNDAVITRDDYESYQKGRGAFINALAGDLVSKTFLFLGFSFTDPNLDQVLSRVRITFQENQRQHYAIFRRRHREQTDTDASFAHAVARQGHVVEDLKRFNVKVILVDEFTEIDEILKQLENRYRRQTVFVSSSAADFSPWGETAVTQFMRTLGGLLIEQKVKIATGLGLGVGNALFTGAVEGVLSSRSGHIEDSLLIRPFPQHIDDKGERDLLWDRYRRDVIGEAGIAIFLFGNKASGSETVPADGMEKEWRIAQDLGLVLLPIGGTGSIAKALADRALAEPGRFLPALDEAMRKDLGILAEPSQDLSTLLEPIKRLITKLRAGR